MDNKPETTNTESPVVTEPAENTTTSVCSAELPPVTPAATPSVCTAGLDVPATPFYKKYATHLSIALGAIIILGAGGYVYATNYVHDGIIATIGGKDIYMYPQGGVVATVNGTKIYRKELNESFELVKQSALAQGADLTDEATLAKVREQALEVIITSELVSAAATDAGITVSDADVQAKYDELVTQFGTQEELSAKMVEVGLTEERLRQNIKDSILADRYVENETDIENLTVSDDEVKEFLKAVSTDGAKLPPLEEIRPQIEAQILQQKQQVLIEGVFKKLRESAEVEISI